MKGVAVFVQVLCYLAVTYAWKCVEAPQQYPAAQIDAGQGMVVMTDQQNQAYFLSGSTWYKLGTVKLQHVSVGPAGIWGVDTLNKVYKYVAGDFVPSEGLAMKQVDAGGLGQVVGVSFTSSNNTYCLQSTIASSYSQDSSLYWNSLSSSMIYYSCGPLYGCWGTDSSDKIYVTQTFLPNTCEASGWLVVEGAARMVEVGTDGTVFVLNAGGDVYLRNSISSSTPQGSSWTRIPMCFTIKHITYDLGQLWVVTTGGIILKCSQ
ncbi:fish-egg lectin-like [Anabas testudineus]|uniref:Fish-egg lectin-like n=1 Tax=Anabas testudineus TaxID=64144 RepID=A0A3Q1H7L7_ANATE|nr:fish-egg lectin-like [Anabas testudineus]XP_026220268.1 fish-egg lectin-like [Anabas testudineus]